MKTCEICGKKISVPQTLIPRLGADIVSVCDDCHRYGRGAEIGSTASVEYFTKRVDLSNATEKGRKAVEICMDVAKQAIEGKIEEKKAKEEQKERLKKLTVVTTDTILGFPAERQIALGLVTATKVIRNSDQTGMTSVILDLCTQLNEQALEGGANGGVTGLKINTLIDMQANILVTAYGTAVFIDEDDWQTDE